MLSSSGSSSGRRSPGRPPPLARPGRGRRARRPGSRCSERCRRTVPADARRGLASHRRACPGRRPEHQLHLPGVATPRREQRVPRRARRRVLAAERRSGTTGADLGCQRVPTAPATGAAGRGGRPVRRADRLEHVEVARRQPGQAEQRQPRRAGRAAPARPAAVGRRRRRRSAGLGSPDPLPQQPPQLDLPDAVVGRLVRAAAATRAAQPLQHVRAVDGVAVEEVGDVADAGEALRPLHRLRVPDVLGQRRQPGLVEVLLDHLDAAATRLARAPRGRPRGRCPRPRPARRRPAPRETGSRRWRTRRPAPPGRPPGRTDRRWVSQRSMPRVGTETTSGVIGSSSGSATRSASIDTSASARSERWTCSIPAEYVAAVPRRSAIAVAVPAGEPSERSPASSSVPGRSASGSGRMICSPDRSSSSSIISTAWRCRGAASIGVSSAISADPADHPEAGNLRAETSTRDSSEPTALL